MQEYIFIHGKNASLSQAEMQAVFHENVMFQQQAFSVVLTDRMVDQRLMNSLGGIIKIAKVFTEDLIETIMKECQTEKILFAVSQYAGHDQLSKVLIGVKKKLRTAGRNARFLNKNFTNISSGQLNQSGILEKGIDLVRCFYEGKEHWAKTIAFQDIDAYSLRDFEKPHRDMQQMGMMPPKLAQVMINLAQPEQTTTIYDPFCGLGTTLIEGMLRGNPVMGSDIKGRLVENTVANLHWIQKNFPSTTSYKLEATSFFPHDATLPFSKEKSPGDMVVVSEGYLGPLLLRFPNAGQQKEIFELLHGINGKFFFGISQIITKGKRIVFCLPFFRSNKEKIFYPESFIKDYADSGFTLTHPLRAYLYEREGQVVGREIVVFEKIS
jgi:tRNA G10  N-methylase Trm11